MITKEYLAGFVDGEGSISCYKRKDTRVKKGYTINAIFSVSATNKEVIQEIANMVNLKFRLKSNGKNCKQIYELQIQTLGKMGEFLETIKDSLIVKKKQAELMIEYCKSRINNSGNVYSNREIQIADIITKLNKRGVK